MILVCVGIPLQVWAHQDTVATIVGIAHGYLFMVYLLLTFDLARRAGWRLTRVAFVGVCGTVPFLSFWAERKVTGWVRAQQRAEAELVSVGASPRLMIAVTAADRAATIAWASASGLAAADHPVGRRVGRIVDDDTHRARRSTGARPRTRSGPRAGRAARASSARRSR